jgi:hypothetical protein
MRRLIMLNFLKTSQEKAFNALLKGRKNRLQRPQELLVDALTTIINLHINADDDAYSELYASWRAATRIRRHNEAILVVESLLDTLKNQKVLLTHDNRASHEN